MSERDGGKLNKIGIRLNKQNILDSSRVESSLGSSLLVNQI